MPEILPQIKRVAYHLPQIFGMTALWGILFFGMFSAANEPVEETVLFSSSEENPSLDSSILFRGNLTEFKIEDPYHLRANGRLFGEWSHLEGRDYQFQDGFSSSAFGGSLGIDKKLGPSVIIGGRLGGTTIKIDPENPDYDALISNIFGVGNLGLSGDLWYWDFSLGVGRNKNRNEKKSEHYRTSFHQTQWNYGTELGTKIRSGYTKIEPYISFRYSALSDGENDPFLGEDPLFSSDSTQSYKSALGVRFAWDYATFIAHLKPTIWGAWSHEYGDKELFVTNDQGDFPLLWRHGDYTLARDHGQLGVGVAAALRNMVDLWLNYNADFANRYNSHSLFLGTNIKY